MTTRSEFLFMSLQWSVLWPDTHLRFLFVCTLSFIRPGWVTTVVRRKRETETQRRKTSETPGLWWFVIGTIKLQGRRELWLGHEVPKGQIEERRGEERMWFFHEIFT